MKTYMHFCAQRVKYLLKRRMFRTKIVEKNEKRIFFPQAFRSSSKGDESDMIVTLWMYFLACLKLHFSYRSTPLCLPERRRRRDGA
jgi:hypothetical protein